MQKVFLIILSVFALVIMSQCTKPLSPQEQEERDQKDREDSAAASCRAYINEALKDPSSAKYGPRMAAEKEPGVWFVYRELTAKNSFNANVKGAYSCLLKYDGENFTLIKLKREK